jgi:hypothetical protein
LKSPGIEEVARAFWMKMFLGQFNLESPQQSGFSSRQK